MTTTDKPLHVEVTMDDDGRVISGTYLGRIRSPERGDMLVVRSPRGLYHIPVSMARDWRVVSTAREAVAA